MSADATGWTIRHSPYKGAQLMVHLMVADSVNDQNDNEFWMRMGKLAEKARVTRASAVTAMAQLEEDGFLTCLERNTHKPSRYRFLFPDVVAVWGRTKVSNESTGGVKPADAGVSSGLTPYKNPSSNPRQRAANPPPSRNRDLVWDAIVSALGWEPKTKAERGRVGTCARELRKAHPDKSDDQIAAEIPRRAGRYRQTWPGRELSPESLVRHWSRFAATTTTQHRNESLEQLYG